jgi:hypothetical protein
VRRMERPLMSVLQYVDTQYGRATQRPEYCGHHDCIGFPEG